MAIKRIPRMKPRSGRGELVTALGALVDACERATGEGPRGVLVLWPDGSSYIWRQGRFVKAGEVDLVHRLPRRAS